MVIWLGCSSGYAEMAGFQMDSEGNAKEPVGFMNELNAT